MIGCILVVLLLSMTVPNGNVSAHAQHTTAKPTANQIRQALKQQIHVTHAKKVATPSKNNTVHPAIATALPAYNNVGTSDDSNRISGSLDGNNSYSAQALQGAGIVPGQNVTYNNVTFVWPNVAAGLPNNYQPNGQIIPVTPAISGAVKLGFLGASTNGTASGTATVTYTDGSTSTFTLSLTDWASAATTGNSVVASMSYLNASTYKHILPVSVFYTDVAIPAGKIVQSVTLPPASTAGQLHIFAVGVSGPSYNNTGISNDASPSGANLDGGGYSYSATALTTAGVNAGTDIPVDGISYPWPTVNPATADNYQAAGQTLPVVPIANATVLGFLGAASGGDSSGTVTVTFTDGSTQTSTLSLSDWTLHSSTGVLETTPSFGNLTVATMTYRNTSTTKQTMNNYLFATEIALPANKTVQSVTLPTATTPGLLHIFAVGTRNILNNIGTSDDNNPTAAHFDGDGVGGFSYSAQALQSQNIIPGKNVIVNGTVYTWPSAPVGTPNNYIATGQTISIAPVANATTLGFLGDATGVSTSGTATITYTDGSTQTITLGLTNWWTTPAAYSNTLVATVSSINSPTGARTGSFYLYEAEFSLQAGKTIQSVTLPATSTTTAQLHIFAISTRSAYNNAGISDDANPSGANFNTFNDSYSSQDFTDPNTGMGWNPGDTLTYNGMNFIWPNVPAGQADNYQAAGQTIAITPVAGANTIGFIGSSSGVISGTATLTYTDNSTSTFTLGFSDWTLNSEQAAPSFNNRLFAFVPHVNSPTQGQRNLDLYLFYAETAISTAKTLKSITLPTPASGSMHLFSIGTRTGTGYLNNIGTSDDLTPTFANYDDQGNSYSLEALQGSSAHITQGQSFLFNGVTFQWPASYSVIPDNYESAGSYVSFAPTIPVTPIAGATTLAFIGSATNGAASVTATITYTDNTTSTFSLGFADWTAGTPITGSRSFATMPYRNSITGRKNTPVYLYETETSLAAGKTIKSVTLPSTTVQLHVFAVGTK